MHNKKSAVVVILFLFFCKPVAANTSLQAAVSGHSGLPEEHIYLGITVTRAGDDQAIRVAGVHEQLEISATVVPSLSQVGRSAQTYFVAESEGIFYAANDDGEFHLWDGSLETLPANRNAVVLDAQQKFSLFRGKIPSAAAIRFYFGFSLEGGTEIFHTAVPAPLEIADPTATSLVVNESLPGVDYAQLQSAVAEAKRLPFLDSMLVSKSGHLVLEDYFDGGDAGTLRHIRSITKSITALLVGQAIESSVFTGVDQNLGSFQGQHIPQMQASKAAIEIRHLLSMTSGFAWDESSGVLYGRWVTAADPVGFLLSRDLAATPGTAYAYNSAAVNLFSPMIKTVTGKSIAEFARDSLLDPMGISAINWEILGNGLPNSASGVSMRPADLIILGNLILNGGLLLDKENRVQRIINADWLNSMFEPRVIVNEQFGGFALESYASLWWIARVADLEVYLGWGWAGQFLAVIPALDLTVVTTADWYETGAYQASYQERRIASLIIEHVLPAFAGF